MITVFLADGFEEIEALATVDILRRAGLCVQTVGVMGKVSMGSHQIPVTCDCTLEEFSPEETEMVILPGGKVGTAHLDQNETVRRAVSLCAEQGKPVAAICAAPSVLGHMGLLQGRHATCYPGFEGELTGAIVEEAPFVVDGSVITGRGAGATILFARASVAYLCGQEKADEIARSMMCPDL